MRWHSRIEIKGKYVAKYGYIHTKRGLRDRWKRGRDVKAVMVYIKVVLKPPSASHNSEAIQEAQEEEKICISKKSEG